MTLIALEEAFTIPALSARHPMVSQLDGVPVAPWFGHHVGFMRSRLDSRYPTLEPGRAIDRPPSRYVGTNILITTSGVQSAAALRGVILEIGAEAIMFAIDYPWEFSDSATQNFAAAELSAEERELISHRNAERLLKLPPRPLHGPGRAGQRPPAGPARRHTHPESTPADTYLQKQDHAKINSYTMSVDVTATQRDVSAPSVTTEYEPEPLTGHTRRGTWADRFGTGIIRWVQVKATDPTLMGCAKLGRRPAPTSSAGSPLQSSLA